MKHLLKTILIFTLFVFMSCENDFVTKSTTSIKGNPPPVPPPLINWSATDFVITNAPNGSAIVPEKLNGYLNNSGKKIWFNTEAGGTNVEVTSQSFDDGLDLESITLGVSATSTVFTLDMGDNPLDPAGLRGVTGDATIKLLPTMFIGADRSLGNGHTISFSVNQVDNAEYAVRKYSSGTNNGIFSPTDAQITGAIAAYNTGSYGSTIMTIGGGEGVCNSKIALLTAGSLIGNALNGTTNYSNFIATPNPYPFGSLSWVTEPAGYDSYETYDGDYTVAATVIGHDNSEAVINFTINFVLGDFNE
ncbi:MAG: hypothetical protein Ta2F_14170 [Termitinemataceae bacterium]|nr:MAG: hypothetical protein Ta2F_14170 [Termitinemataceae bacterium]